MNLDKASKLINDYGLLLENDKYIINSISSLPSSKKDIKEAIKTMILSLVAKKGRSFEGLEQIKVSYASLADFIEDKDAKIVNELEDAIQSSDITFMASENAKNALKLQQKAAEDYSALLSELNAWLNNI